MNVVGIIGSLRKESIHKQIFAEYKAMTEDLFELEKGSFEGLAVYDGEDSDNSIVTRLQQQILQADGVIFFTPEYNYSVPGGLKNAIDWLSRCDPQPFLDKPASIVGASPGNIGTARMQYHLRQIGVFLNLHFMNKPEAMIGQASAKLEDGKLIDQSTRDFLRRHAEAFVKFVDTYK